MSIPIYGTAKYSLFHMYTHVRTNIVIKLLQMLKLTNDKRSWIIEG